MKALGVPTHNDEKGPSAKIASLKKKYPVLADLSDEAIMERIKNIYAEKIMVDLYFSKVK